MKKKSPFATDKEIEILKKLNPHQIDTRIGHYYRKLEKFQKRRFTRITASIAKRLGLKLNQCPVEIILIRQIALNTIRIEEAELYLLNHAEEKWENEKLEKWLVTAQKERREAIKDLSSLSKMTGKKGEVDKFKDLRDALRSTEKLPESKKVRYNPDGHDRRHYDRIERTKKQSQGEE